MRLGSLVVTVAVLLIASTTLSAQCPNIAFDTYGQGCSPFFTPPDLSGSSGTSGTCTVDLTLTVPPACCNVFPAGRVLIVGLAQTEIPFPELGPRCTLLVEPLVFVSLPVDPETLTFSIPSGLPLMGVSIFTQGAVEYFTTIGMTTDFALSNGMRIDFS